MSDNKFTVGKTSADFYPTYPVQPITPMQPVNITPSQNPQPYKCPVCGGSMLVPGSFYTSVGGYGTSSSSQEKCRSCVNGIIWG